MPIRNTSLMAAERGQIHKASLSALGEALFMGRYGAEQKKGVDNLETPLDGSGEKTVKWIQTKAVRETEARNFDLPIWNAHLKTLGYFTTIKCRSYTSEKERRIVHIKDGESVLLYGSIRSTTPPRNNTVMKKGVYTMKKLISCLLVVIMLFAVAEGFAESLRPGRFVNSDILRRFRKETDTETKDLALQVQSGNEIDDVVIRIDGDNLHLVPRTNGVANSHIQLNPTGIYLDSDGTVTLLRYATVITVVQDIIKEVDSMLEQAIESIPEEELPSEDEMKKAVKELSILASAVKAQEQADAATLSSAAIAFANKFKPEYILDIKEEEGSVRISLRSEAFATALAEAIDEMMSNPALAELANRQAAMNGDKTFADIQQDWEQNREATLAAIRSIKSTDMIDENGHWVSHFQIGEELSATKILMCDTDAWIDAENGEANITCCMGFKNEDPIIVYQLAVTPYFYNEKLSSGNSMTEIQAEFENDQLISGNVLTMIEGKEEMRAYFGPDYLFMKGPKGCISTSVRETWTGKIRYELVAETAEGKETSIILDFYQEEDSLVCELSTNESDRSVMFKISRIDKLNIEDLSASENINEITVDQINAVLESLLNTVVKTNK